MSADSLLDRSDIVAARRELERHGFAVVPLRDYVRLVDASEADDMICRCETCGAWIDRNEPAYCTADEFTGCWKAATGKGLCVRERGELLELANVPAHDTASR